jgi:hypothetical protein
LPPTFWRAAGIWLLFSIGNSGDVFLLLRARLLGLAAILIVLAYALYNVSYSATGVGRARPPLAEVSPDLG